MEGCDGGGGGAWSMAPIGEAGGGLGRDGGVAVRRRRGRSGGCCNGRGRGGRCGGGGFKRGEDGAGVGPQGGWGFVRSWDQNVRGQSAASRRHGFRSSMVGGDRGSGGEGGRRGGGGGCQRGGGGVQEHGVGDEPRGGGGRWRGRGGAIGSLF